MEEKPAIKMVCEFCGKVISLVKLESLEDCEELEYHLEGRCTESCG